jgi:hypothetical protein
MRDITYIVIHHIGPMPAGFPVESPVETIRAWHKAKGWSDIGYHKLITPSGKVLQGRPDAVVGAHAFGANTPSLGVNVIGDFSKAPPQKTQLDALVQTLAVLCKRHGIPVNHVIGHRDVAKMFKAPEGASACPGDGLYGILPDIRKRVAALL